MSQNQTIRNMTATNAPVVVNPSLFREAKLSRYNKNKTSYCIFLAGNPRTNTWAFSVWFNDQKLHHEIKEVEGDKVGSFTLCCEAFKEAIEYMSNQPEGHCIFYSCHAALTIGDNNRFDNILEVQRLESLLEENLGEEWKCRRLDLTTKSKEFTYGLTKKQSKN